jgi:hypothetical protein
MPKILGWFGRACVANNQIEVAMEVFPQSQGDLVLFLDILESKLAARSFKSRNLCDWLSDSMLFLKKACKSHGLVLPPVLQLGFRAATRLAKPQDLPGLLSIQVQYRLYVSNSRQQISELFRLLLLRKENLPEMQCPEFFSLGVVIAGSKHPDKEKLLLQMIDWMDGLGKKPTPDFFTDVLKELRDLNIERSWKMRMLNYLPESVVGELPGRDSDILLDQLLELIPVNYEKSLEIYGRIITLPVCNHSKKANAEFMLVDAAIKKNDLETVRYLWNKTRKYHSRWLDVLVKSDMKTNSGLLEEIFSEYLNSGRLYDFYICSKVLRTLIDDESLDSGRRACVHLMEKASAFMPPTIVLFLFCHSIQ